MPHEALLSVHNYNSKLKEIPEKSKKNSIALLITLIIQGCMQ